ncbi:MAG: universal stress protein [Acidobacteria bacterium]|nr:MAG: universal stress protein [Acidobacteriota bacterium]
MIALKYILVPTDFSETSDVAVRYGVALARAFKAKLDLLHVIHEGFAAELAVPTLPLGLLDGMQNDARDRLAKILTEHEQKELRSESVLRQGAPDLQIVGFARERDVDLIVMGTHGRSGVAHILMGGVAEKVVRKAPCPVLTVRHPEHEFVIPEEEAVGQPERAQLWKDAVPMS